MTLTTSTLQDNRNSFYFAVYRVQSGEHGRSIQGQLGQT